MNLRRVVLLLLCFVVALSLNALANDPSGRVARLNYISGQVSLQPGGVNDWVAGNINRPLTTADRVWTDRDARAELQMGAASARLNGETSLTLANVSDNAVQLQLDQGTLNLHVVKLYDGEIYEIDTPNLAFTVQKSGDYRFDVDNAGDTTVVTVWKGRGEATGDNPGIRISGGQQFTFRGGRSLNYASTNAPGFDGFDSWCKVRADREDRSPSLRYVSPYAVGYSDLDEYGRWETVSPYGAVWIPAGVATGWAPYRWGHWVYIAPWGWTWVDDAPWGFAPFHYGRWVRFGGYWGWCPGPLSYRPIYAPALVGWFGGSHFGVGLSFGLGGGVGWFPLGWGEPYIPYYNHSRGYFHNVNVSNTHITNITYVTNNYYGNQHPVKPIHYVNEHVPEAVTAVSNATFTGARPTRGSVVPVSSQAIAGAAVMHNVPVRPTRESVIGPGQHTAPPPVVATRPVVTKMPPPNRAGDRGADFGRPSRMDPGATATTMSPTVTRTERRTNTPVTPAVTNSPAVEANRPSRAIPRPPQRTPDTTLATEERPRGIPHPPESLSRPMNDSGSAMPSRVSRQSPGTSITAQPNNESNHAVVNSPDATPSRVPHPPSMMTNTSSRTPAISSPVNEPSRVLRTPPPVTTSPSTPERTTVERTTIDRPTRQAPNLSQEVPRPVMTPRPTPSPVVNERPVTRSTETHVAPPTSSAPVHNSPPPAVTHPSQPARETRPSNNVDKKDNAGPKAGLRYPSPYNQSGYVRPASFTETVPRPSGPVAAAPRVAETSYGGASSNRGMQSRATNVSSHPTYTSTRPSYAHTNTAPMTQSSSASVSHSAHASNSTGQSHSASTGRSSSSRPSESHR